MLRLALGVIAGFVVWSVAWIGSDAVIMAISPAWYGKHQADFVEAMTKSLPFTADSIILVMHLIRAVIVSVVSGMLAAFIAKENFRSTLILGILLLAFGAFVQAATWSYLPLWYHVSFLLLLIPATMLGGKLIKS